MLFFYEPDIDDCQSSPCENGGICSDKLNDYTCSCIEGYTGKNCALSKWEYISCPKRVHLSRGVTGQGTQNFPGRNHYGGTERLPGLPKSPHKVASTVFSSICLLPKDLGIEHGNANFFLAPRHLTPLRPGLKWYQIKNIESNTVHQLLSDMRIVFAPLMKTAKPCSGNL